MDEAMQKSVDIQEASKAEAEKVNVTAHRTDHPSIAAVQGDQTNNGIHCSDPL